MADLLNSNVIALMRDPVATDRVLRALCANDGTLSYMDGYQLLQDQAVNDPSVTVRGALSGRKLDAIQTDIRTLEAAAAASDTVRQRVALLLDLPGTDRLGRVMLDSAGAPPRRVPSGSSDDRLAVRSSTYQEIWSAPLHSERLHRARALTGNAYAGPDGAKRFQEADRAYAEGNADLVASLEAAHALQTAAQATRLATAALDAAFQQGSSPKQRAKAVKRALDQTRIMLDQMEQSAETVQPVAEWSSDRTRLLHSEVQQRRARSGRSYLVELSQMGSEGL